MRVLLGNTKCFICDNNAGVNVRDAITIFGENSTLTSGKKLRDTISQILDKPIEEPKLHSSIICKQCYQLCVEFDQIESRIMDIKQELIADFKTTLPKYNFTYNSYERAKPFSNVKINYETSSANISETITNFALKTENNSEVKSTVKMGKIVLPASKFKKLPPDFVFCNKMMQEAVVFKPKLLKTDQTKVIIKESRSIKPANKPETISAAYTSVAQLEDVKLEMETTNANFEINNFSSEIDNLDTDEQPMEIYEESNTSKHVNQVLKNFLQDISKEKSKQSQNQIVNISKPSTSSMEMMSKSEVSDSELKNQSTVKIVSQDNLTLDDDSQMILMEQDENGSIIRVMQGENILYSNSEQMSLDANEDSDLEIQNDPLEKSDDVKTEEQHDSDSQIELQLSGDEETANAIIEATKSQGGAYIKVKSGVVYRVETLKVEEPSDSPVSSVMEKLEDGVFECLLCKMGDNAGATEPWRGGARGACTHARSAHNARLYHCEPCAALFSSKLKQHQHLVDKHSSSELDKLKNYNCSICEKKFGSRNLLEEHLNAHNGVRPYKCDICQKTFSSKYTHLAHLKTHLDRPRPFTCSICPKSFFTHQNLIQHEKTHSGVKEFICKVCNKAFGTQHNLEVHGVVHSGKKPFKCSVCTKAFARRAEIRDHIRTHTGERPFACDMCGAQFSQRSNLLSHRRATHLDDKRHACPDCDKRFKRRRLLEYHIKASHTGERPYRCDICRATFVYPEHYKKHVRIHSGERPYVCEVCGKSFNSRDNRNSHRFVHSDKKPYECLVCGAGYMRKPLLYAHMHAQNHLSDTIVVNQPRLNIQSLNTQETDTLAMDNIIELKKSGLPDAMFGNTEHEVESADSSDKQIENTNENNENDDENQIMFPRDQQIIITGDKTISLGGNVSGAQTAQLVLTTTTDAITGKNTFNLVQGVDGDSSGLLLQESMATEEGDGKSDDGEEHYLTTQQVTGEEEGGMIRLVQIQLPNGDNGWVAITE